MTEISKKSLLPLRRIEPMNLHAGVSDGSVGYQKLGY